MVAAPLGTTITSGKVRLYCDILMGALTNSTSQSRDISAAAFLAGDGAKSVTGQVLGVNGGFVI